MTIRTEEKVINNHKYVVSLFPAMQGYLLARKLIDVFVSDSPVSKLCEIDKDGSLLLELLSNTIRDDLAINKGTFDNIFTGNLKEMMDAVMFVFEVNFKDFLGENAIGELTDQARVMLQTPQENLANN